MKKLEPNKAITKILLRLGEDDYNTLKDKAQREEKSLTLLINEVLHEAAKAHETRNAGNAPMLPEVEEDYNGVSTCMCPKCNKYLYFKDHCVFCGQKIKPLNIKSPYDNIVEIVSSYGRIYTGMTVGTYLFLYIDYRLISHAKLRKPMLKEELQDYMNNLVGKGNN